VGVVSRRPTCCHTNPPSGEPALKNKTPRCPRRPPDAEIEEPALRPPAQSHDLIAGLAPTDNDTNGSLSRWAQTAFSSFLYFPAVEKRAICHFARTPAVEPATVPRALTRPHHHQPWITRNLEAPPRPAGVRPPSVPRAAPTIKSKRGHQSQGHLHCCPCPPCGGERRTRSSRYLHHGPASRCPATPTPASPPGPTGRYGRPPLAGGEARQAQARPGFMGRKPWLSCLEHPALPSGSVEGPLFYPPRPHGRHSWILSRSSAKGHAPRTPPPTKQSLPVSAPDPRHQPAPFPLSESVSAIYSKPGPTTVILRCSAPAWRPTAFTQPHAAAGEHRRRAFQSRRSRATSAVELLARVLVADRDRDDLPGLPTGHYYFPLGGLR